MVEIIDPQLEFSDDLLKRSLTDVDVIVLHHSGSDAYRTTIHSIHRCHLQRNWLGCGYHYVIHQDGSIFQGRPADTVGAHARGYNERSIGICVVGNFEIEYPTIYQQESLGKLLVYLINDKLQGQSLSIKRHKDVTATLCPGKNFTYFIPVLDYKSKEYEKLKGKIKTIIETIEKLKNYVKEGR